MIENEDSVVTSLNELRKLKHDRITRQRRSHAGLGVGRAVALAEDPASEQMTPPPAQGLSLLQAELAHAPSADAGFAGAAAFAQPSAGFNSYAVAPPVIQTQIRPSYKAAVAVAAVLIAVGGAGYVKLQNDSNSQLMAKDTAIKQAEEARNKSVEIAAKSEKQSKTNLRQCEEKLSASLAAAAAVAPATLSSPAVEKKAERPSHAAKVAARSASHKGASRSSRHTAQADAPSSKSVDVPTIAKKKNLDNDPLSGLGKL